MVFSVWLGCTTLRRKELGSIPNLELKPSAKGHRTNLTA